MLAVRAYELMIIFDAGLDEAGVQAQLAKVTDGVRSGGGTVATTDLWGLRRFAYEIDHRTEGIYVVLEITTEARDLTDVERALRLADEVVRHKLIRLPDAEAAKRGLLGETAAAPAAGAGE